MRRALWALLLLPAMPAQVDTTAIRRATIASLEKRIDKQLLGARLDDPFDILGGTRGLYLEGYGAVFTTELSLVVTPALTPFRPQMPEATKERIWQRKVKALPVLREEMRKALVSSADSLAMIPKDEQVVLAVRLLYVPYEKTHTLPGQIIMRGDRASLMKSGASLTTIRTEEF